MKLFTFAVYDTKMCMKEKNPGLNNIKGYNYFCMTGVISQF